MATNIPAPPQPDAPSILENVPVPLRVAGAWSWRLIVVGVVAIALATVLATLSTIVVPIAIALLIAAPLSRPSHGWSATRSRARPVPP